MVNPRASTSGVLPMPICLFCGVEIQSTDELGLPQGQPKLDKQFWKSIGKPDPEKLMVSAYEVENAYHVGKFPRLWSCLYRAIIKDSSTKYRLTGINLIELETAQGPFYAVNDPTKARISGKKNTKYPNQAFTQFYAASIERQPRIYKDKTIGYFIHAHCWTLFGQVEGPEFNNIHLAKLVRNYRNYWQNNDSWWEISPNFTGTCELTLSLQCDLDVSQSSLVVPAIQEAIEHAKTDCYHPSSVFDILPLELIILISEYVCPITDYTVENVRNLGNLLSGFGWELPAWFWRVRFDESLFFELGKLTDDTPVVDWKARLNLMSLIADKTKLFSSGLVNRKRLLGIMLSFKKPEASKK